MDPSSVLVLGLGLIAGDDQICKALLPRFAERILCFGNIYAQRAVPLMLALTSLSDPKPELVDNLAKLALNTDKTLSFNAIIALGLIGAGTQNFKIAGVLRHCIESKCYSEEQIDHVIFGAHVAFGLLNAGKGLLALTLKNANIAQMAALCAVLFFQAPSEEVVVRAKCQPLFYLLGCALGQKARVAVDATGLEQKVNVRAGKAVEELSGPRPFRLAGFALHQTPVVSQMTDAVFVVDEEYEPVMDGLNGVGGVPIFVVREAEKT